MRIRKLLEFTAHAALGLGIGLSQSCGRHSKTTPETAPTTLSSPAAAPAAPAKQGAEKRSRQNRPVRIVLLGDTLIGAAGEQLCRRHGYNYPLQYASPCVRNADLIIANLEGPITRHPKRRPSARKAYYYRQSPAVAPALRNFGIDWVNLANNHAMDFGADGLTGTLRHLTQAGINWCGAGSELAAATAPCTRELAGTRIGLVGFWAPVGYERYAEVSPYATVATAGTAPLTDNVVAPAIAAVRRKVDVLIVTVHWGQNYQRATDHQRQWGKRLIDLGADAVIGHGSHIAEGIDVYNGRPILYSLGNFVFNTTGRFARVSSQYHYGWAAELLIVQRQIRQVALTAIRTNNQAQDVAFQPKPASPRQLDNLVQELSPGFNAKLQIMGNRAVLMLPKSSRP